MTILDACVEALQKSKEPMNSAAILEAVKRGGLYEFGAKDPRSILRGTLRKHLRSSGPHRVEEVSRDLYRAK